MTELPSKRRGVASGVNPYPSPSASEIAESAVFFEPLPIDRNFAKLREARYEVDRGDCWLETKFIQSPSSAPWFMIATLFTSNQRRGEGLASRLMRELVGLADREGANLCLKAAQIIESGLSDQQLVNFYSKFGFELVDSENNWMEREIRPETKEMP